jgi:large subunit ribosomal protein L24
VQTTLLGLAIAIILALVSALVAPLVVDWNQYRGALEAKASELVGLSVHVKGPIEARILPTPLIKLRTVEIGEKGHPPNLRAGALELEVRLGPLLRGEVRASELHLVAPEISLGLDDKGNIDWPAMSATFRPDALSVSRVNVEDARVTLTDAASGSRLVLQKLWFNGEIRSFAGPFAGEGAFVAGNELYGYRISGGRVDDDGALKLKLGVDPSDHPLTTEVEGTVTLNRGVPQFDGTLALARPVGATLSSGKRVMSDPWHIASKLRATPASALLQDIDFQYGPDERALKFTGTAEIAFGQQPHLQGVIAARQVDIDRALAAPDLTRRPPLTAIKTLADSLGGALRLPIPAQIGVGLDIVTLGGTTLQSLHGDLSFDSKGWSVDKFEFRAPGFSQVNLSGRIDETPQGIAFKGPAEIESADFKTLVGWLEGRTDLPPGQARTLRARGDVNLASDKFAVDDMKASFDREQIEGHLAYSWAADSRPATLDAAISAPELDLDALYAFSRAALAGTGLEMPRELALAVDIGKATFAGVDANKVNAQLKFDAGVLQIDRLAVAELGGASLDIKGRIDELSSQPRGSVTLSLDASALAGLAKVVAKVAPGAAEPFRRFADRLAPANVHGSISFERASSGQTNAKLGLNGQLAAMKVNLTGEATGDPADVAGASVAMQAQLDAADGTTLLAVLGLDRIAAVANRPGRMTLAANGPLNGALRLDGLLATGGLDASAKGTLRLGGDRGPTGGLQLKLAAADLRPLVRAMNGQAGDPIPATLLATLGIAGSDLSFKDLTGAIGKSSLRGRVALDLSNGVAIDGDIDADTVDAQTVLAAALGFPAQTGSTAAGNAAPWPSALLAAGAFSDLDGAVRFKLASAALSPALTARDVKGVARFHRSEIDLSNVDATLAGGRLSGALAFRRGVEGLTAHGHIEIAGADAAALFAPGKNSIDGRLTITADADGIGLSPLALIGSLHGGGTVSLAGGHLAGLDATAFDAAMRVADQGNAVDAAKVDAAVNASLANGRLAVPQANGSITITGGLVRIARTTVQADGGADLAVGGLIDLTDGSLDANLTLSGTPGPNALISQRPELLVALKGPLSAPRRTVDISALTGWLALRAADQQARRLEAIEANRRAATIGPVVRPESPPVRFAPDGTAIESPIPANAPPSTVLGARSLDRLLPEAPPPAAPQIRPDASDADQGGERAPAFPPPIEIKPPVPRPAPPRADNRAPAAQPPVQTERPPLDLLFRPQN